MKTTAVPDPKGIFLILSPSGSFGAFLPEDLGRAGAAVGSVLIRLMCACSKPAETNMQNES